MLQSRYNDQQLKNCAKDMLILLQNADKSNLSAVKRKFATQQFGEISKIQIDFTGKSLVTNLNCIMYPVLNNFTGCASNSSSKASIGPQNTNVPIIQQ